MASMISEIDIWRSAVAMFRNHGDGAASRPGRMVRKLVAAGDREGTMTWLTIRRAIYELEKFAPETGERSH